MNVDERVRGVVLAGSTSRFFSFFSQILLMSGTVQMQKINICDFCCPALLHPLVTGPQFFSRGFAFLLSALTSISSRWACNLTLTNQIISVPWQQ